MTTSPFQPAERLRAMQAANTDASAIGSDEPLPRSSIESTYQKLRVDIVHSRHESGAKLRLHTLSEMYRVSVGTIREALSLLVSDGLVVLESQRGFRVAPLSLSDLGDLTRLRMLLEGTALRYSIEHGDDLWEGRVVDTFHRLTLAEQRLQADPSGAFPDWEGRNREFHVALVAAYPSPWFRRFDGVLYLHSERYRRILASERPNPGRVVHDEHSEIFNAALARDADRAVLALEQHIFSSYSFLRDSALLPTERRERQDGNTSPPDGTLRPKVNPSLAATSKRGRREGESM
ncbi:FCD domain-containing protein [Sphingomonadaceae bacterium G21617-S1]|nr:FCD domain-containing protein [Sphingomonadaceae bacterium G21617-S1]